MGIDPVTTTVGLALTAAAALALYYEECAREEERRRRQEEDSARWRREVRNREKEARRRERERERERQLELEEEASREEERELRQWEHEQSHRRNTSSNILSEHNYRMESTSEYYRPQAYYYGRERDPFFSPYSRYSSDEPAFFRATASCSCDQCNPEQARSRNGNSYDWSESIGGPPIDFNPFTRQKNSIKLTITPPKVTQDKNPNAKNKGSNDRPSSSNSQGAATSNASKENTKSAPKASQFGSQQPERNNSNNNNNNNNNNKNNNNNQKDTVQDYGKLNGFIKNLKTVLDQCNASLELREKILSFFKKFEKHEENFLRLLEDFQIQGIAIKDILAIVIRLFQSDYFSKDVAFENFIALMEIVAKYIKDELFLEMVGDMANKKPFEQQRAECMQKVLERTNILDKITDLFETARKEIVQDNTSKPLEPDFSGIFTKVYHYLKHKVVRGKEWTVAEYFDVIRKLLVLLKGLRPEYEELTDGSHARRQIVLEVYSTDLQIEGRLHIVVRAYGPRVCICTFFVKEKRDKKAKDGDKYVDGQKKP